MKDGLVDHSKMTAQRLVGQRALAAATLGALVGLPLPASALQTQHVLSFDERVACQTAVEEVYDRHRLWPHSISPAPLANILLDVAGCGMREVR